MTAAFAGDGSRGGPYRGTIAPSLGLGRHYAAGRVLSRPIVVCATPKVRAISIKLSPASRRFNASYH